MIEMIEWTQIDAKITWSALLDLKFFRTLIQKYSMTCLTLPTQLYIYSANLRSCLNPVTRIP